MPKSVQKNGDKIRYALVGLGWIAQEAVLPAFQNAANAEVSALVTDDPEKAAQLSQKYKIPRTANYDEYDELLKSGAVDAVYIALPNSQHKDYTVRAAKAGVHVLCEKPMADTVQECEEMIHACEQANVKLMIAYRLHFEPGNLQAIDVIQKGTIGEPRIFSSVFGEQVVEGDIRLKKDLGGGPLMDLGVYPINAARYLFQDEPIEVTAGSANSGDPRFKEVYETVTMTLRFPQDRLGILTCSFGIATADSFEVAGTKGDLWMKPAFDYHEELHLRVKVKDDEKATTIPVHDQFAPELEYFADCIRKDEEPEPNGREGLADIRIIEAARTSIRTRQPVTLEPFEKKTRPSLR
jgi:glucose-fructose oxidoreductase